MDNLKGFLVLVIMLESLNSCLVTLAPKYHNFVTTGSLENSNPKISIFSTPSFKDYVVTGIDIDAQVFIKSPVFENPNSFYAMENESSSRKHYKFQRRDRKFYRTSDYTSVTLKIIGQNFERTVNYIIADK